MSLKLLVSSMCLCKAFIEVSPSRLLTKANELGMIHFQQAKTLQQQAVLYPVLLSSTLYLVVKSKSPVSFLLCNAGLPRLQFMPPICC